MLLPVWVCDMLWMHEGRDFKYKHMCLWMIRWIILLLLSVTKNFLSCPLKIQLWIKESWQLLLLLHERTRTATVCRAFFLPSFFFFFPFPLPFFWLKKSLEASFFFSPLHSTGCSSLELACYNLLSQLGAVSHYFRINGCRCELGCYSISPCSNKQLIDFILIFLTALSYKQLQKS